MHSDTKPIAELLALVTALETKQQSLENRREQLMQFLKLTIHAQNGFWGWGRGMPLDSSIAPVAVIPVRYTLEKWKALQSIALSEFSLRTFSTPIRDLLQTRSHVTISRSQLWTDEQWYSNPEVAAKLHSIGVDNSLISVNYFVTDNWTSATFFREMGEPDFAAADRELVDLAMGSIAWMKPKPSESVAPSTFVDLSPRQRTVMLLLLDGLSRKEIAADLNLSLHTVNDHCKELFTRFEVNSAMELASRFLRSS